MCCCVFVFCVGVLCFVCVCVCGDVVVVSVLWDVVCCFVCLCWFVSWWGGLCVCLVLV